MKLRSMLVAGVAALSLAMPATAFAKERRQVLPDGSIRVINVVRTSSFAAPSTTVVTVDVCPPNNPCANERMEVFQGRSVIDTVTAPLAGAASFVLGNAVHRPTRINSTVQGGTATGGNSNAAGGSASASPTVTASSNPTVTATANPVVTARSDAEGGSNRTDVVSVVDNETTVRTNASADSLNLNHNRSRSDSDAFVDNETNVATDDGAIDSFNTVDSYNRSFNNEDSNNNSNNTIDSNNGSFNEDSNNTTIIGGAPQPPPPPVPPTPVPPVPPATGGTGGKG